MERQVLATNAPPTAFESEAEALLAAFRRGDPDAVGHVYRFDPRFRRSDVTWLHRQVSEHDVAAAPFALDDARLVTARAYEFLDWDALIELATAVQSPDAPVARFEAAVDAVVRGEVEDLRRRLADDHWLVDARSTRRCPFDPPVHRSTLLHYVAANGVEGYRQRTPPTAVEIARTLLEAGAAPDATASLYGGEWTTLGLLVSSGHPAAAGLQVTLVHVLVDYGASLTPAHAVGGGTPLLTALTFGYLATARALVERGAPVDTLPAAAGLGEREATRSLLPRASEDDRHRALALAAALGQVDIVRDLLDAGGDPNAYNPPDAHAHATPLHSAVAGSHADVVRLLLERGARRDIRDRIYDATPLGWAEYLDKPAIAALLRD